VLRFGVVSNIKKDSVSVIVPDKDNTVSAYIPLLANMALLPKVGEPVVCIFEGEGLETGICLGLYYNADFRPKDEFLVDRKAEIEGKTTMKDELEIVKNVTTKKNLEVFGDIRYHGTILGGGS